MKLRSCLPVFTLLTFLSTAALAQSKDEIQYRKDSEKFRKDVWGWDKAEFKNREVSAQYNNVSKVVLAHHTELTADSKSKLLFIGFGPKKEVSITEIVREMIKLNDKAAVDEYSEFTFTSLIKKSGFMSKSKFATFVGVRVIKPDQSVKEINADDIVLTENETKQKKAKLAIPDLQPGDIIDYFIATDQAVTNDFSERSYNVYLFDDAPVLHYSFHGQLGKKFAMDYRSYNGAPELKLTKNDEDDVIMDLEQKNMAPFETSLWVAPALQLPLVRMIISLGYRGIGSNLIGANKPGDINKNKSEEEILDKEEKKLAQEFISMYGPAGPNEYDEIVSEAKRMAKAAGVSYKEMSDNDKAATLYYAFRFTKMLNFDINQLDRSLLGGQATYNGLAMFLHNTLKAGDLEPALVVTSPRTSFRSSEVLSPNDLVATAYLVGTNTPFAIESIYDVPFVATSEVEGTSGLTSYTMKRRMPKMGGYALNKIADARPGIKIPASEATKNAHIEQLVLALNPDQVNLSVQRKSIVKGHYKYDLQKDLILYEDFYEAERKALGKEEGLIEELEGGKKSRKFVDEVKNAFAEARKKNKDAFIEEAKGWFEQEVTDFKNYKVDNLGVRHTAPDFIYSSAFNLGGLVKKAGNNIIVEIGKIQGQPLAIKPEQRKRDLDIYMPYGRTIEYQIELKIPEGYSAEGVDALNRNVTNETGFFTADASVEGNAVYIKVRKTYAHAFEPAKNWEKLVAFIDASNDWTTAKLLFKKK